MSAEHLIITRFSVRFAAEQEPPSKGWFEDRLRLLEAYCLPGMERQTETRFRWALLCDESTEESTVGRLEELTAPVPGRAVIRTTYGESVIPQLRALLDPATEVLVTTRLDSDDGIAVDLVERIRSYLPAFVASPSPSLLLSFSCGRTLETTTGTIYDSYQPQGPFMSLFERLGERSEPLTVYSGNHAHLYLEHPQHIDVSGPAWLQVVHGANVSNHVRNVDLPSEDEAPGSAFSIRPQAARGLTGAPGPGAEGIREGGERGTEGVHG